MKMYTDEYNKQVDLLNEAKSLIETINKSRYNLGIEPENKNEIDNRIIELTESMNSATLEEFNSFYN